MNIIKKLCVVALLSLGAISANAQLSHLESSVYMNGNFPVGNFARNVNDNLVPMNKDNVGMDAIVGFGLGLRVGYNFDIGFGSVTPYVHLDFNWNALRGAHRDQYSIMSCKAPSYVNIPVYVGVNYRYHIENTIFTPFVEFGVGSDALFISKEGDGAAVPKIRYKPSMAFAWQVGLGTYLGEHVSASLHYSGLGRHTINYTSGTRDELMNNYPSYYIGAVKWQNLGMLSLRIGFHF